MSQVQTGSYPIAEDVMQLARSAINDMQRGVGGSILADNSPFTAVYLSAAIRRVQRELANNGITSNIRDNVIIGPIPPAVGSDPSIQIYISQTGYFDGANQNAQPTLPADLILPLQLWERQSAAGAQFQVMTSPQEGLQSRQPGSYFGQWEWREDRINLTGSTMTEDIRIRYEASLPRVAAGVDLTKTVIAIRDGEDALAAAVTLQYAFTRGSQMRADAKTLYDDMIYQLVNRYVRKDQRIGYRPRGFRAGGGRLDGALQGDLK